LDFQGSGVGSVELNDSHQVIKGVVIPSAAGDKM
jgi:hypothetical protein